MYSSHNGRRAVHGEKELFFLFIPASPQDFYPNTLAILLGHYSVKGLRLLETKVSNFLLFCFLSLLPKYCMNNSLVI